MLGSYFRQRIRRWAGDSLCQQKIIMVLYITKVQRSKKLLQADDLGTLGRSGFDLLDGLGDVSSLVSYTAHLDGTYFDYRHVFDFLELQI
jgi:hypothetical protein